MSNEYRPIDADMIRAMLDGKILETSVASATIAYYDNTLAPPVAFRYSPDNGQTSGSLESAWDWNWRIREESKTRPMTLMERLGVLTRKGCVVRNQRDEWRIGLMDNWTDPDEDDGTDEWAIIDKHGNIIDGPNRFEVEE